MSLQTVQELIEARDDVSAHLAHFFDDMPVTHTLGDEEQGNYYDLLCRFQDLYDRVKRIENSTELRVGVNSLVKKHITQPKIDARLSKSEYLFLTVNPDTQKVGVKDFENILKGYLKLCFIEHAIAVIEQRSVPTDDGYHGWHCHAVIKRKRKPSYVAKETDRYWRSYVGNSNHIRIAYISDDEDLKRRVSYIIGMKKELHKQEKQLRDKEFVKQYSLQFPYIVGDPSHLLEGSKLLKDTAPKPAIQHGGVQEEEGNLHSSA